MKKNNCNSLFVCFLILFILTCVGTSHAGQTAPPSPPPEYPHPPITADDIRRVGFGKLVITNLFSTAVKKPVGTNYTFGNNNKVSLNIDEACLKDPKCLESNDNLLKYVKAIQSQFGVIQNYQYVHVIPWSFEKFEKNKTTKTPLLDPSGKTKSETTTAAYVNPMDKIYMAVPENNPDEFMMHAYVVFDKSGLWHHMDIVVHEDSSGKLYLRRVYFIQMPYDQRELPPGVQC